MSETSNQNIAPQKWYQCHYRVIGVALCLILILLVVGHLITYSLINKQGQDSTKIISTILTNASTEKSLIPDIVLITKADSSTIILDSTIKKELINFLVEKYTSNNPVSKKVFDIKPYLSSTDVKDEDKIIKHIEFLASTVHKAVEESKANIDTEISKINTWVTIWIGVIGFIGIFLPIVINIKSFDDLKNIQIDAKEAKEDSQVAKKKSNEAMTLLDTHKKQLEGLEDNMKKVGEFEKSIKGQEKRIEQIDQTATIAKNKSLETEESLSLLISLFKLKDINYSFLAHQKEPLKVLIKYFEEIQRVLSSKSIDVKHPFVLDALRQLASRLYELSTYHFVSKDNMILFNDLSDFITERLEKGMTEESLHEILKQFHNLITELKK